MRQVPQYLLIGNGRVARHFQHYFSALKLNFTTWNRAETLEALAQNAQGASHILVLISDEAIETFINVHLNKASACIIHCSGAMTTDQAYGAHPLMTFGPSLYEIAMYRKIPFIIDAHAPEFVDLLPGLPNPHQRLDCNLKAKYHALCVLSGNFTSILWQKLFQAFATQLNLSPELAHPYLQQQMYNLMQNPEQALTGPLVRNDQATIIKNLEALVNDPAQGLYQSFVDYYQKTSAR